MADSGSRIGWWVPRSAHEIGDLARFTARNRARSPISLPRRHEPPSDQHTAVSPAAGNSGSAPTRGRDARGDAGSFEPSGTLFLTMTATVAPPLLDDPSDLTALRATGADPDALFARFSEWAAAGGTTLYPAQEEALIELVSGANVVLSTPTGSGKSLVATGAQYAALAAGRRSFYTAPIKALVS